MSKTYTKVTNKNCTKFLIGTKHKNQSLPFLEQSTTFIRAHKTPLNSGIGFFQTPLCSSVSLSVAREELDNKRKKIHELAVSWSLKCRFIVNTKIDEAFNSNETPEKKHTTANKYFEVESQNLDLNVLDSSYCVFVRKKKWQQEGELEKFRFRKETKQCV